MIVDQCRDFCRDSVAAEFVWWKRPRHAESAESRGVVWLIERQRHRQLGHSRGECLR